MMIQDIQSSLGGLISRFEIGITVRLLSRGKIVGGFHKLRQVAPSVNNRVTLTYGEGCEAKSFEQQRKRCLIIIVVLVTWIIRNTKHRWFFRHDTPVLASAQPPFQKGDSQSCFAYEDKACGNLAGFHHDLVVR